MKIGLIQADGKLPNIAIMKLAAHHKLQGDSVEWWLGPLFDYGKVYCSKIFSFTDDDFPEYVKRGGTGYNLGTKLPEEIEAANHGDGWFMYPKYTNHIGFSERGCRLNCSFCVVPEKDGKPKFASSIGDLLSNPNGGDRLVLLDDDFLGHPQSEDVFSELIDRGLRVCFSQGLNIRLITEKQAGLLARVKFWNTGFTKRQVTFAWDQHKDKKTIEKGFQRCVDAGVRPYQMQFFVLIGYDSIPEQDLDRVETIRAWGADPFVMAYRREDRYQRRFQRWVNHRAIFRSIAWRDYV